MYDTGMEIEQTISKVGTREMGLMNGRQKFHFATGLITGLTNIDFLPKIYNRAFKYFIPCWIISHLHCNFQNHTSHVIYWYVYLPICLYHHQNVAALNPQHRTPYTWERIIWMWHTVHIILDSPWLNNQVMRWVAKEQSPCQWFCSALLLSVEHLPSLASLQSLSKSMQSAWNSLLCHLIFILRISKELFLVSFALLIFYPDASNMSNRSNSGFT